jgi:Arylsulfotransferase (ASST)
MRRPLIAVLAGVLTLGLGPALATSAAAPAPTLRVSVSGTGVGMYPGFSPSVRRYGVTTAAGTHGAVTVHASSSDPAGRVWIDGRRVANGAATRMTGLTANDEISVFIKDRASTHVFALVYLPAGFPTLNAVIDHSGVAAGDVFLTLTDFTGTTPSYETAVDRHGVPIYVHTDSGGAPAAPHQGVPLDFKRQPNGDYSVYREPTPTAGRTGGQEIELNSRFQQIAAYETDGDLTNTDGHDALLLPDGDRWLVATQANSVTGKLDAYIQEQAPDGTVLFQWDSADHIDPSQSMVASTNPDYMHINSIWLMGNGDILASFRHLSAVLEIATSAHDGFQPGDIVWELGGRDSSFTFPNDPNAGPCAQHSASELPNGDILVFDDGSESINGSPLLCVDPTDPSMPAVARPQTRVTEYSLDTTTHQATLVWSYQVTNRDTVFAGSAQRLSNGDTMVGWGGGVAHTLATEVGPGGDNPMWELSTPSGLFSYRALKFVAPDAIKPVVDVVSPAVGATYAVGQKVVDDFTCTDKGGSSLQTCNGSAAEGGTINTSTPGRHTFTVTATDGAGNRTTVIRTYRVGELKARYQPDGMIKGAERSHYVGNNVYGKDTHQHVQQAMPSASRTAVADVKFQNDGNRSDSFTVIGTSSGRRFRVAYFVKGHNVTAQIAAGSFRSPTLAPRAAMALRVVVTRTSHATAGATKAVKLTAISAHAAKHDSVATLVRVLSPVGSRDSGAGPTRPQAPR